MDKAASSPAFWRHYRRSHRSVPCPRGRCVTPYLRLTLSTFQAGMFIRCRLLGRAPMAVPVACAALGDLRVLCTRAPRSSNAYAPVETLARDSSRKTPLETHVAYILKNAVKRLSPYSTQRRSLSQSNRRGNQLEVTPYRVSARACTHSSLHLHITSANSNSSVCMREPKRTYV